MHGKGIMKVSKIFLTIHPQPCESAKLFAVINLFAGKMWQACLLKEERNQCR